MSTRALFTFLAFWTCATLTSAQTAAPVGEALGSAAVVMPKAGSAVHHSTKEAVDTQVVPLGTGSGIYDPYEGRVLGKQRWEKDSFLQFLYHTPGTRHETPVVYGPLKEGC
ncbi:MAG: hypothetical protein IPK99_01605 [Flavobacteriales bacterium]|nr:hypothetical protein [Flavobacteriales bacterium]